jgi:hypothetical protein
MRHQGTDRYFGIEAVLRDLLRDVVRDKLRYLREDILGWIQTHEIAAPPLGDHPKPAIHDRLKTGHMN